MISLRLKTSAARFAIVLSGCVLAAGCGGSATSSSPSSVDTAAPSTSTPATAASDPPAADTPSPSTSPSGAATAKTIKIILADEGVSPNGKKLEVAKDTLITLQVRSDHADEIHVHGYDVEKAVPKDETITVSFKADKSGSFEIESHEPAKVIVILNVR